MVRKYRWIEWVVCLCLLALIASCVQPAPGGNEDELILALDGGAARLAGEGDVLTLRASATRGQPPYFFRWSQERGPAEVLSEFTDDRVETSATSVETEPIEVQGDYIFRVRVADSAGAQRSRFVTILVGPPGTGDGFDAIIEGPERIVFGDEAELTASAPSLGAVSYDWTVVEGSATLDTPTESSTSVIDAELGAVVVRLRATEDDTGATVEKTLAFDVIPRLTVDAARIAVISEPVELSVEVEPVDERTTFEWTIISGSARLDDGATSHPSLTTELGETIGLEVMVSIPVGEESEAVAVEEFFVVSVADLAPRVLIQTRLGDLALELDAEAAPLNAANFLQYTDEGFYDGVLLHRYSCDELDFSTGECILPFVVQGGGLVRVEGELQEKEATRDPVVGEADNGLSNVKYSVAMALSENDPDSATTQFFINLNDDNARLDGQFTVFGTVVEGFEVLDAITQMETGVETIIDPETGESLGEIAEVLVEDVVMDSVQRIE